MRRDRLAHLSRLIQGAALLGVAASCHREEPSSPDAGGAYGQGDLHINAPPTPTPTLDGGLPSINATAHRPPPNPVAQ